MAANKEYKQVGHEKRRTGYGIAETLGVVIVAGLITYGLFTLEDVERFVDLLDTLAGIAAGIGLTGAAHVARNNVEPPSIEPSPEPRHGQ